MDLYAVDLSSGTNTYIVETQKNLDRISSEVAGVNGVLLFDDADGLVGMRSEVRDDGRGSGKPTVRRPV